MLKSSNKPPANTAFKQQRLRACQPIYTPIPVSIAFGLTCILFIILGALVLYESNSIEEYSVRYDNRCNISNDTICQVSIDIEEDMESPVYFYYKLKNYYQNHRRYVKSRNDEQLSGETINDVDDLESCDPRVTKDDEDDPDAIWLPCGLIAGSTFTDSFQLASENLTESFELKDDDIAWESDLDEKFKDPSDKQKGIKTPGVESYEDPRFVVWMRVAGLPTFNKLYGIIDDDLKKGTYQILINNTYDVDDFDGEKHVVLSESSWIGGKNSFLGITYIVTGVLCGCFVFAFLIAAHVKKRKLGDLSFVNFNADD